MKQYLFITSIFPPLGGPGIQRQLYYIKYSVEAGWKPIILTVKKIMYHFYDETLLEKIPEEVQIVRTETLEFGRILHAIAKLTNILSLNNSTSLSEKQLRLGRKIREWITIVDDRIFWIPFALPAALRLCKLNNFELIVARGGPHSNLILAYWVSRLCKKPLIIDLADPWIDYPYLNTPTAFHAWVNKYWEEKILRYASKISVSCQEIKRSIVNRYDIDPGLIKVITNGYDREDYEEFSNQEKERHDKLSVVYLGSMNWIRIQAFESLCKSLQQVFSTESELKKYIKLKFIGSCNENTYELLKQYDLLDISHFVGYLPHREALLELEEADLLFLPVNSTISNPNGIYLVPGKFYEYVGARKPILYLGPLNSDIARMINEDKRGYTFDVDDDLEITGFLRKAILDPRSLLKDLFLNELTKYERKTLAYEFTTMLNDQYNQA
jgi:glycosyltransferase involved in cell wall biosynthesis